MPTKNRFLLLYGSQTGQAKAISEEIAEKAEQFNLKSDLQCLSQTEKKFNIEREHCVVIVVSTTGDGEPPDTAQKFVRRLKKKTLPSNHLENLNYALLGLGDSNYTNFCNNGKTVDRRLEELGAKRFYESGWADDAVGLEVAVEPWMDGLFPVLQKFLLGTSIGTLCDRLNKDLSDCVLTDQSNNSTILQVNGSVRDKLILTANSKITLNSSSSTNKENNSKEMNQSEKTCTDNVSNTSKENSSVVSIQPTDEKHISSHDKHNSNSEFLPSLITSVPPLSESALSIPVLTAEYLNVEYHEDKYVNLHDLPLQNGCPLPSASCSVSMATIMSANVLTSKDSVKKTLCLKLDTKGRLTDYLPGDSISVVVKNDVDEVEALFKRLGLSELADKSCTVTVIEGTKKRNAAIPPYIPPSSTLRHIFVTCLDIREPPKKALLRVFVEYTSDQSEKRRLQELCSKQGADDYSQFLRQPSLSLMDLLDAFPSCNPPVERLLEHLSRLQPRPYSICSSPLVNPGIIEISFNVVNIPSGQGRSFDRTGVCTGMLDKLTHNIQKQQVSVGDSVDFLSSTVEVLAITEELEQIPIFNRTNQHFRMVDDLRIPIIMIGPGTGVAPFVGFLQHRQALKMDMSDPEQYGETYLFFGCRHEKKDYIFRKELEEFQLNGVLSHLFVCFSRDNQSADSPKYVQDNIRKVSTELSVLIMEKNAMVFVCGDAKNMAKDVNDAFISIIQSYKGCNESDARAEQMKMRLHKRYLEDVWT